MMSFFRYPKLARASSTGLILVVIDALLRCKSGSYNALDTWVRLGLFLAFTPAILHQHHSPRSSCTVRVVCPTHSTQTGVKTSIYTDHVCASLFVYPCHTSRTSPLAPHTSHLIPLHLTSRISHLACGMWHVASQ